MAGIPSPRGYIWNGLHGHEPETLSIYPQLLSNAKTVFDVGASTGLFSLIAGKANPNIDVHAFEPVPETFSWLVRNIGVNGLKNVIPVQACVTNYDGEIAIYPNESPVLPLQTSVTKDYQGRETLRKITTRALTLDSYVATIRAKTVDLLKVDVEASDHIVLEGAREVLKQYRPLIICEVLYQDTDQPLQRVLEDTGYDYFHIVAEGLLAKTGIVGDSNYIFRNYLFVHQSKLAEVAKWIILS